MEGEDKDDVDLIRKTLDSIRSSDISDVTAKVASLKRLTEVVRDSSPNAVADQLKSLLRFLLEELLKPESAVRASVLEVLTEMVKKRELSSYFANYAELLVLRVLHAPRDGDMDVSFNPFCIFLWMMSRFCSLSRIGHRVLYGKGVLRQKGPNLILP